MEKEAFKEEPAEWASKYDDDPDIPGLVHPGQPGYVTKIQVMMMIIHHNDLYLKDVTGFHKGPTNVKWKYFNKY